MRTGAAKRTMFRKFFAVVVSAILLLTAAASICASADDKSEPEFTKEEFLEILRNAENAAVLYTRPEASTRTELAKFISSNFINSYFGKRYEGKGSRLKGGLSRPGAFLTFLHQYFTYDLIDALYNGHVFLDWEEDQVYWYCAGAPQISYDVGTPEYSFKEFSADRVVCHMDLHDMYDLPDGYETAHFDYVYEKTAEGWKFTSFVTRISIFDPLFDGWGKVPEGVTFGENAAGGTGGGNDAGEGEIDRSGTALYAVILLCCLGAVSIPSAVFRNKKAVKGQALMLAAVLLVFGFAGCTGNNQNNVTPAKTEVAETPSVSGEDLPPETPSEAPSATPVITPTSEPTPDVTVIEETPHARKNITSGDWYYSEYLDGNNDIYITIKKYKGTDEEVIVPDEIEGVPVLFIKDSVFDAATSPETIRKLTLPARFDTAQPGIYQALTGLEEVVFSGGLVRAEKGAFKNCRNLRRVTGAEKLEYIDDEAFYNCSSLEKIEYSPEIKELGKNAFYGCQAATGEVVLPASLTRIGAQPFYNAKGITKLTFGCDGSLVGGNNAQGDNCSITLGMTGLEEIVICDGVTEITPSLFTNLSGSASIKKLVIPESVRSIGQRAFENSGLSGTVVIPDSVTSIGVGCFRYCDKLEKIVLPKGLATLEASMFYDCDSLTEIVLPAALSSIGSSAFAGCCSLKSFTVPDSVTSMGDSVFWCCDRLSEVVIGDNITALPARTFAGCADLRSISLPHCTSIGDRAFYLCTGLESVSLRDDAALGESVFDFCFNLYPGKVFDIPRIDNG